MRLGKRRDSEEDELRRGPFSAKEKSRDASHRLQSLIFLDANIFADSMRSVNVEP